MNGPVFGAGLRWARYPLQASLTPWGSLLRTLGSADLQAEAAGPDNLYGPCRSILGL